MDSFLLALCSANKLISKAKVLPSRGGVSGGCAVMLAVKTAGAEQN